MEAFPNAKVLLTTREPGRWYHSVRTSVYKYHCLVEESWVVGTFMSLIGIKRMMDTILKVVQTVPDGCEHSE